MCEHKVSVVVPVFNGAEHAEHFVDSMSSLSYPRELFEVIIVDNESDDDAASQSCAKLVERGVSSVVFPLAGVKSSYAARNLGVKVANGDIIAFTDFDCRPAENWLHEIVNAMSRWDVVAGEVRFVIDDPSNLWEQLDSSSHMQNSHFGESGAIATANMAVRRSAFDKVGEFIVVESGADFNWSRRATEAGLRSTFCSDVLVLHPTRKSYAELRSKFLRISRGDAQIRSRHFGQAAAGAFRLLIKLPFLPRTAKIIGAGPSYFMFRVALSWIRVQQLTAYVREISSIKRKSI